MKKKLLRITTSSISLDLLLKGQLAYLNNYYDVVGLASGKDLLEKVSRREGIRTIELDMKREISPWADFRSLLHMIRIIKKEKPFIVHANTPKGSLLGMTAARVCRVPHRIYTVTGLRFETASGLLRKLLIMMERITCRMATKVIPEGDGVKHTLHKEKITSKPLKKILNGNINGVDMEYFQRTAEVRAQAEGMKKEAFTFCFIGRMVKDKGVNELVRAFDQLSKVNPDIHLMMVGPLEQKLDPIEPDVVEMLQKHPAITFTGYQPDIRPFLAASDTLVFPSYREGFPNVVLQAGAMGLASIVTDINGSNEIILEGKNGIIIKPKDKHALYEAINYFVQNRGAVAEMAANARLLIESRYEQKMVWKAILEEYQGLEDK